MAMGGWGGQLDEEGHSGGGRLCERLWMGRVGRAKEDRESGGGLG